MQPSSNNLLFAAFAVWLLIVSACAIPSAATPAASTPSVVVALASPTTLPTLVLSPTRTPTPIILAVELTPTPQTPTKGGVVWDVVITSKTSRQYMDFQKGTLLNTCFTNWRYSLFYVVFPNNAIKGHGYGVTQTPLNCTPHALPNSNLVTTDEEVSVDGTQDNQTLNLQLGVVKIDPNPSGDNGGVLLLFSNGACPPVRRTIQIPINNQTDLSYKLTDQGQLTGCAGSGKDLVQTDSVFEVWRDFDCANVPPNIDQQIIDLCK